MPIRECPNCHERVWISGDGHCPRCLDEDPAAAVEISDPVPEPAAPRPRWARWGINLLLILAAVTVVMAMKWVTARGPGGKCGGAFGCKSGLVCVQSGVGPENRRCREVCQSQSDCRHRRQCLPIGGSSVRACMSGNDGF